MGQKIIIDCDPGIDDALALILAFLSPELEIAAITGVNGNVPLSLVMENIKKILSLIKPQERPWIAPGAAKPLKGKAIYAYEVHGEDGLGGAKIDLVPGECWWQVFPKTAEELILDLANQYPEELTLIAIGPLTNLALALQKDPAMVKKLKKIIIMGGAVREKGNITPYAEFNFYVDPLAAKIVLEAELPITLVPLDVTHQVYIASEGVEKRVSQVQNPFSKFLLAASGYDCKEKIFRGRKKIFYLHDPLAIGVAVNEKLVEKEIMSLSINTEEGLYYGQVIELATVKPSASAKVEVALKVKSEDFLNLFWGRLGK